jgi:hypothetical protein
MSSTLTDSPRRRSGGRGVALREAAATLVAIADKRARKARSQREWRQRRAKKRLRVSLDVTARMVGALCRWGLLQPDERGDRREVAAAIEELLTEAIDRDPLA